ncbi:MAG: DUF5710 domain-containing protein [Pseudonocardia sp.]|nr:DUF5710 domain-containing protein [Pseudonocardia sp.]
MAEQPPAYRPTTSGTRVYLDVPYSEKEAAKALGARWDQAAKRWYDPRPPTTGLDPWAARPPVPDLLPGEDRAFGAGLFVDMVPRWCWFTNVRSCVTPQDWERLRHMITRRAGQRCEACWAGEDRTVQRWLEAHERWAYDDRTGVQALRRLICLCSDCHLSTHLGLANVTGRADQALAHLRAVTGMTDSEVSRHVQAAGELWTRRSARVWTLDLTMLTDAGVTLARPETAADRAAAAERELRDLRGTTARVIPAPRTPPEQPQHRPTSRTEPPNRAGPDLAALLADSGWLNGPDDLARNAPGIGVSYEAARRLHTEGVGADHSWRVGADGEITVAAVLSTLTTPSRLNRLRRRSPAWKVLHSVPVGTGRGDIDHVLIGPPGVVTINTKHHRAGRLALDGDELIVNGRATDYIPTARREALRAAALLGSALDATGHPELAARLTMRPVLAIVGGRVLITSWAPGVSVVMTRQLTHTLTSMPPALDPHEVDAVYGVARHRAVWARSLP